ALAPVEVTLAALGELSPEQRAEAATVVNLALEACACRLEWMRDPWDELARAGEWLRELAARTRPDVVHLNHYAHGGLSWGARVPRHLSAVGQIGSLALRRLYAEASIYAWPARYEPFGLSVLEAALSGCALVLGDIPSLRELWEGAAWFVPADDDGALAAAI